MALLDDNNVGGGQGGAVGNAGGNGGKAVVDRLKSLELGGLSSFDPKGGPTMCMLEKMEEGIQFVR